MKLPCKDCLILAICRHKDYHDLLNRCDNMKEYLISNGEYNTLNVSIHKKRFIKFEKYIRPTRWRSGKENERGYELDKIKEINENTL